ncbi:MAG TPA: DNA-protecting protein DprA [Anaerolineae bacterium]|nr:DNA-protecting protein DprA [Anaerolineae bacterium]
MRKYWLGFNLVPGIGSKRLRALIHAFGDVEAAWRASERELAEVGLDRRSIRNLLKARERLDLDAELTKVEAAGVRILTWDDPDYPTNLKRIDAAPPLLYLRGELSPEDEWAVAVVGTRRATAYDREVTRKLTGELARAGVTIVSGLARGIDAEAHRAALDAGGRTIAVLGNGLDRIYPPEHRELARAILHQGALISEQPLGMRPDARNFPARNRIISGLSLGVLVVACPWNSGAIITAKQALEQGREVFAVPGGILSRNSEGPNRLLKEGATPVTEASDILEALNLSQAAQYVDARLTLPEDPIEAQLLEHLSAEPRHVDEIRREVGLPVNQVSSALAMMELKGMVRSVGGMKYVLAREPGPTYRVD